MANKVLLLVLFLAVAAELTFEARVSKSKKSKSAKLQESIECQKDSVKQLEQYMNDIELLSDKRKFPETIPELHEACKINKRILSLMSQTANKCMFGFAKNVLQVTIYSIRKSQKMLCRSKPNKEMRELISSGKCVNAGRKQFRECIRQSANVIYSTKFVEDKQKIAIICCEIVRGKKCLIDQARNVKGCKEEHIEALQNRFNHVSSNSIGLACGDYNEETNKCDKVVPPKGDFLKNSNKTLAMTMFELVETFPYDELQPQPR